MAKKKSSQARNALRERLKSLESQILDLKNQASDVDAASFENLEKISKIEERRTKNLKEYYKLKKQINDTDKDSLKNKKKGSQQEERLLELQEKSSILMKSFNADTQKSAQILGITAKQTKELSGQLELIKNLTSANKEQSDAFQKTMAYTVRTASSLDDLSAKILDNMENMNERGYELIDTYRLERELKEQIARIDYNAEKMGYERWEIQRKMADSQLKELQNLKSVNVKLAEKSKLMKDQKESSNKTRMAFLGLATALPAGNFLFNKMGLGKIIDGTQTVGKTIKGWGSSLKGLVIAAPFAALFGIINLIVGAFKFVLGTAFELDTRISNLSKNLSISRGEATKLEGKFAGMALKMNLIGINTEQFGETLGFLSEEYGASVNKIMKGSDSSRFVQNITVLREKFQLTNEEALNFGKISSVLGVNMGNLAYQSVKITKAFLNNRQIIKAMANVPQIMATGMKGAVDKLVQFVAKAKMLGIDLKGFASALENTLDIESSLEKQFTAETITGVHFKNMDAIRLAINSMKYDKAFDMLMDNFRDIRSLSDMPGGLIGVRSIADLFGFSLEDFTQYFNKFQELRNVFGGADPMQEASKYMNMTASQLRKEVASMSKGARRTFLENLAAEKEGADIQTKFMDKMNKIKLELMQSTLPIVDELHTIFNDIVNNPELKKIFKDLTSRLPDIIKSMIDLGRKLKSILGGIYDFLVKFGVINEPLDETQKQIAGMNTGFINWGNTLKTVIGLFVGYKGLTWGIKTAFDAFKSNILGLGPVTKTSMEKIVSQVAAGNQQILQQQSPSTSGAGGGRFSNFLGRNAGKLALGGAAVGISSQLIAEGLKSSGNEKAGAWASMLGSAASMGLAGAALGPWGAAGGALLGLGMGYFGNKDAFGGGGKSMGELVGQQRAQSNVQQTPETTKQLSETAKELSRLSDKKIWDAARAINEVKISFVGLNTSLEKFGKSEITGAMDSIVKTLNLADTSKILMFANGIFNIAFGMGELNKKLEKLDINKLEKVAEKVNPAGGGIVSSISNFIGNIFSGVKSVTGGGSPQTVSTANSSVVSNQGTGQSAITMNTYALEQKLDRLITIMSNISSQPTYIKIGEKTVEAIESEMNWKRDLRVSTDNSYSGGQKSGIK